MNEQRSEKAMLTSRMNSGRKSRLRICIVMLSIILFLDSCNPYGKNAAFIYEVKDYPAYHLIWSPTGRYLAFTSRSGSLNISSIYILDIETKQAQRLMTTEYGHLEAVGWRSDESELMFLADSNRNLQNGIWIIKIDGQTTPRLYLDEEIAFGWSPVDQVAMGRRHQTEVLSIFILDPKTNKEKTVFSRPGVSVGPFSWSTDGAKLAFSLELGEVRRRDIYVVNLESQEAQQLTTQGTNDSPSLSPKGNLVVYVNGDFSGTTPSYSLHLMNSDGSCDTSVPSLENASSPAWSPNGKWIAFVGNGNRIFLFNPSTIFGEELLRQGISCR